MFRLPMSLGWPATSTFLETRSGTGLAAPWGAKRSNSLGRRLREIDKEQAAVLECEVEVKAELDAQDTGIIEPEELREALADLEPIWDALFLKERARILALLLERVEFDAASGDVEITFRPGGPNALGRGVER